MALMGAPGASVTTGCPQGSTSVPMVTKPAPAGSPNPKQQVCPDGTTRNKSGTGCCGPKAASAGSVSLPSIGGFGGAGGGAGGGGGTWAPSTVARPELTPINPTAEYDPEMAKALAEQRGFTSDLKSGTGHVMDVMTQRMADNLESQVIQARSAAEGAGIPFDEASFRSQAQRDINAGLATEKLGREGLIGESIGASTSAAGAQAGDRATRLGIDLSAKSTTEQQKLARYGIDVTKYGVDAQAATAANNALLSFYSQLMGGMMGMMGSQSISNTTTYA